MKKVIKILFIMMIFVMSFWLSSCKTEKTDMKKIKDLEFTVVEDADVPAELKEIIEEKKAEPFKLTFSNKDYLYIVTGYGAQPTGGYSITVDDLYLSKNAIYFNTSLLGPPKDESVTQAITYPYIVVKTEYIDKSVVFE